MNLILGIDPGLRTTGFGVIDGTDPSHLRYVASGTICTKKVVSNALPERLKIIFRGVQELVEHYKPHCSCVEIVFVNVNAQSTLLLGQARGACISALVDKEISVAEYTALQMKQSVVGYGRASKEQVQMMVQNLLHLTGKPSSDAADALGLAITHAHAAKSSLLFSQSIKKLGGTFRNGRGL
jgi:crossover junction endodeoxyribonuclease RuvC